MKNLGLHLLNASIIISTNVTAFVCFHYLTNNESIIGIWIGSILVPLGMISHHIVSSAIKDSGTRQLFITQKMFEDDEALKEAFTLLVQSAKPTQDEP